MKRSSLLERTLKRVDVEFNAGAMARPRVAHWWLDEVDHWLTISWGTPYGDAVWSVSVELPPVGGKLHRWMQKYSPSRVSKRWSPSSKPSARRTGSSV